MNRRTSRGFTIIETILFLGVTGLMIVGMFIGIGSSIGAQRYRDSVESFKSLLQQQYADISSVKNGREGAWVCSFSGGALSVYEDTTGSSAGVPRGQARCDIIGKYVAVHGTDVQVYTVLSSKHGTPSGATDIEKLASSAYTLGVSATEVVETQIEWGARLAWPEGTSPADAPPTGASGERAIALLFVRSPDGGGVYTFSSNDTPEGAPTGAELKSMISGGLNVPGRAERLLCIDSDGMVLTGNRGVFIEARAADSSAIRVAMSDDFTGAQRC